MRSLGWWALCGALAAVGSIAAPDGKQFVCEGLHLSFDLEAKMATMVWEGDEASEAPFEARAAAAKPDAMGYEFSDGVAEYRFDLATGALLLRFEGQEERIACAPE